MPQGSMKAVVFKGPGKVVIEDRPIPQIKDDTDIIVRVDKTALCGRYYDRNLNTPSLKSKTRPISLVEYVF